MSIQIYKVNLKRQFTLLTPGILTLVGLTVGYLYFLKGAITDKVFLIVLVLFLLFDILPAIALHIQYLIKNFGAILTIDTGKRQLIYKTNKATFTYSFDDIKSLKYYRMYGKGSGWQSFGMYRYYKIIFTDNNELNITCLMISQIENTLEVLLRIEPEKHFRLLNLI
jgi:hypothetical protein